MKSFSINQFGIIILAGGESRRLGTPKQLLDFDGQSLIRHITWVALSTEAEKVVVVTGASKREVAAQVADLPVVTLYNRYWEEGMASSVRTGVNHIVTKKPAIDGIIILVCDQPFVDKQLIETLLVTQQQSGLPLVGCQYGEKIGVPALFHKSMFTELMELKGDTGARMILANHRHWLSTVNFEQGAFDIDTKEDYERLSKKFMIE